MKATNKNYLLLLLSGMIITQCLADDKDKNKKDKYHVGESIAKELEGVVDSFQKDAVLFKEWTAKIKTLSLTIEEHDELKKHVFDCVKNKFKDMNELLAEHKRNKDKDSKKTTLEIERLNGHIIALERKYKIEIEVLKQKHDASLKELKSCKDLLETLEDGGEERGKAIQKQIMSTREEYRKMVIERTNLVNMLTEFSKKIRSFNYEHHSGLQELANKICDQVEIIEHEKNGKHLHNNGNHGEHTHKEEKNNKKDD